MMKKLLWMRCLLSLLLGTLGAEASFAQLQFVKPPIDYNTTPVNDPIGHIHMSSHRMRVGQPTEKPRHLVLAFWAYDEVPVIGHHAVCKDGQFLSLECLDQDTAKCFGVLWLLE